MTTDLFFRNIVRVKGVLFFPKNSIDYVSANIMCLDKAAF